jgi:Ca2+-binding RTX toxin-like protein
MHPQPNLLLLPALSQATAALQRFASQSNFLDQLRVAFGNSFSSRAAMRIDRQLRAGNFSLVPKIEVLFHGELGTASGAYAASVDKIFVSSDFLAHASEGAITSLLLEEIGHRIDRLLNGTVDSAGDEGEIFSRLVNGQHLSAATLANLQAQNDHGVVNIGGQLIAIEKQDILGGSGNDSLIGTDEFDFIRGLAGDDTLGGQGGNDTLEGGLGNDYLNGGDGNDQLLGGSGNDIYVVDNIGDSVSELSVIITEFDTVQSSVTYSLGSNLERLTLLGTTSINGTGNDLNNLLIGNTAANSLGGGLGADTIIGGAGNDNLSGGDGNDYLYGQVGDDTLAGGNGADFYVIDADIDLGTDTINEDLGAAGGMDTLDFRATTTKAININ